MSLDTCSERAWVALAVTGFAAAVTHVGEEAAALRLHRLAARLRGSASNLCAFDGGFGLLSAETVEQATALALDLRAADDGRSLSLMIGWGPAWQAEGLWVGAELDRIRRAAATGSGKVELSEAARACWGSPEGFGLFQAPAHRSKALGFNAFVVEDFR